MIDSAGLARETIARGLEEAEHRVAAAVRGYVNLESQEWLGIENTLLRLSLEVATLDPDNPPVADGVSDLPVSLLGRALWHTARDAPYPTNYLRSLSAVAYAGAGNFATAGLVAREALKSPRLGSFERWAVSVLADLALRLVRDEVPPPLQAYALAERDALRSGLSNSFDRASELFAGAAAECVQSFEQGDSLLLMLWVQVRRRLRELSAARILRTTGRLGEPYIRALLRTSSQLLYPTQALAIERHRLLESGHNALVVLPTSTGKSLLGELALVAALTDARPLGVYLAPYRALTDQIFRRMRARLSQIGVECEVRRGGYLSTRPVTGDKPTVLVATPEAFDSLLRVRPDLVDRISCCVFDEFHLIEQPVRGLRYEGLLGRLRDRQGTRVVALSPVVVPSPRLKRWLGIGDEDVVQSAWRPTARRLAVAGPDQRARYFTPGDHVGAVPSQPAWIGTVPFPNALDRAPQRSYAHELRQHDASVAENVVTVAVDQFRRFQRPILIVASTREQARLLAAAGARSFAEVDEGHPANNLAREIAERCPYLFTLQTCLKHGVAYHNAALPDWIRGRLEKLMADQDLRIVAATTTLAEGVDLPFRVVVMADWRQWLYGVQRPMPTLLFRNIAGRCGRAGSFGEGDTIIVDNPGRTPGPDGYRDRFTNYIRLYVRPGDIELQSSVAHAVAVGEGRTIDEINAALESQFVAYVSLNQPAEGDEERAFRESLFAARFDGAATHVGSVTGQFVADTLGDTQFAVLTRSSPLAVSEFGRSVLATGLSPRSGVSIARLLTGLSLPREPSSGRIERRRHSIEWIPVLAVLRGAAGAPDGVAGPNAIAELRSGAFGQVGRRGFPVNETNFLNVLMAWGSGLPMEEIAFLTIRNRELKAGAEAWLQARSGAPPAGLEEVIEQVSVFLHGYVAQQWSWVLRGAAVIAEHLGTPNRPEFPGLATRVESGVRYQLAATLLGRSCPIDRSKVDFLVGRMAAEAGSDQGSDLAEEAFLGWLRANDLAVRGAQVGFFAGSRIDDMDVGGLVAFLANRAES